MVVIIFRLYDIYGCDAVQWLDDKWRELDRFPAFTTIPRDGRNETSRRGTFMERSGTVM